MSSATNTASAPKLLTAEEYLQLPDTGERTELRRGVVVTMSPHGFRHGEVCGRINWHIGSFVEDYDLGLRCLGTPASLLATIPIRSAGPTSRTTVTSACPRGKTPSAMPVRAPEIVFEVVSPTNLRTEIGLKTAEYLRAGVQVVCVVDPQFETVNLHYADRPTKELTGDDLLVFDELPAFSLAASSLFT